MESILRAARMLPILFSLVGCGCENLLPIIGEEQTEQPVANPPIAMRYHNWVDRYGRGSCVIASTCNAVVWSNQTALAQFLRSSYSGGQTQRSIQEKLTLARVKFLATENADSSYLEYATRNRRAAIIWFFDNHCVTFCGFGRDKLGNEVAWLLDNNQEQSFIGIPKSEFLKRWEYYGGFALVPLFTPAPPLPRA